MLAQGRKRLYSAEVKNRAEQAKFENELAKLEKEKERDQKLSAIERQKFRSKYSKLTHNEGTEVTMYETHFPGFCFTRSGEQKNLPRVEIVNSLHFKHIHTLIFTDGEVDLEKIICLHLLCPHRTETLTPPKRKMKYMCKQHSPTERLIERSKRGFTNFERLYKLLPLYAIELISSGTKRKPAPLINDGRLASRILINEKVMTLINTVVMALEKTNVKKFQKLLTMGNNPLEMRRILGSRRNAEFLDSLIEHQLINCCDFFVLTPPFKIKVQDLDVKTSSGSLENLVSHLRQNVLQQPIRRIAKDVEGDIDEQRPSSLPGYTASRLPKPTMNQPGISPGTSTMSAMVNTILPESSKVSLKVELRKDTARRSLEDGLRTGRRTKIDFIAKNKEAAAKTKRIEYDLEDEDEWYFFPKKRSSTGSARSKPKSLEPILPIQSIPLTVEEKEPMVEEVVATTESDKSNDTESDRPSSIDKPIRKRPVWERPESKNNIRQTTCPACMERWKVPLPTPKTPRVKKADLLPELYSNSLRTNSQNRVSMMINKAMYKLQSYDRRYSSENENSRKPIPKKRQAEDETLENVYLNPMDLAKIEQEIKERETKKKLENFLNRYSHDQ